MIYSHVVRGSGSGERLFQPFKLGIEDTFFDWLDCIEEILVRIETESLRGKLQSLVRSILTIGRTMREEKGS